MVTRPGYAAGDPHPAVIDLDAQAAALLTAVGPDATLVGVSGGATLILQALLPRAGQCRAAMVHEPLLGPLVPALHARVAEAVIALSAAQDPAGAQAFVRGLVGDASWDALPASWRQQVAARARVVVAEAQAFAAFAPSADDLEGMRAAGLVTTVGARSWPARADAAAVLRRHAGARVVPLPDAGHLAHVDAPAAFAAAVLDVVGAAS